MNKLKEFEDFTKEELDFLYTYCKRNYNERNALDINDIIKGVAIRGVFYEIIPDRAAAIHAALSVAEPEDTVLVLGKGHEEYMIIGKEKKHFSDQETIAAYLSRRMLKP